jgi:hypothetical protein
MRGPEAKLYQKFKKATPKILWHRIEGRAPRFGELETL